MDKVRRILYSAGCYVTVTLSPPPAVGGLVFKDTDPFLLFFDPPYRNSMASTISDAIDRAIGVIQAGGFDKRFFEKADRVDDAETRKCESRKIFIVHGHDEEAKQSVARFLQKLDLEAIILHEQPSSGKTVIEKLEHYVRDIAFAIVLLTPDDLGCPAGNEDDLQPRARQNVILELGYLTSKLGRERVCALIKNQVEKPSDYDGVVYVSMEDNNDWQLKVAREMRTAGITIDLNRLS
ncbi:MAG: nucleotide-binding protein [Candidatus Zixiibacteriota bacterium]